MSLGLSLTFKVNSVRSDWIFLTKSFRAGFDDAGQIPRRDGGVKCSLVLVDYSEIVELEVVESKWILLTYSFFRFQVLLVLDRFRGEMVA